MKLIGVQWKNGVNLGVYNISLPYNTFINITAWIFDSEKWIKNVIATGWYFIAEPPDMFKIDVFNHDISYIPGHLTCFLRANISCSLLNVSLSAVYVNYNTPFGQATIILTPENTSDTDLLDGEIFNGTINLAGTFEPFYGFLDAHFRLAYQAYGSPLNTLWEGVTDSWLYTPGAIGQYPFKSGDVMNLDDFSLANYSCCNRPETTLIHDFWQILNLGRYEGVDYVQYHWLRYLNFSNSVIDTTQLTDDYNHLYSPYCANYFPIRTYINPDMPATYIDEFIPNGKLQAFVDYLNSRTFPGFYSLQTFTNAERITMNLTIGDELYSLSLMYDSTGLFRQQAIVERIGTCFQGTYIFGDLNFNPTNSISSIGLPCWVILLIIIVVLIAIGVIVILYLRRNKDKKSKRKTEPVEKEEPKLDSTN
jgi:hypothetical protein